MAMLAEKRQRKSYNLLSRGKPLYEDDFSFGLKMMEKMGWSKGRGLGANENGNVDFVRVKYKNNAEGFGYEDRDNQWINHEIDFNSFLNNLNTKSNIDDQSLGNIDFSFDNKEVENLKCNFSGESLEKKSKNSRARVHYKKFTRGKDISRYSEKDLANIFGKKSVNTKSANHNMPEEKNVEKNHAIHNDKKSETIPEELLEAEKLSKIKSNNCQDSKNLPIMDSSSKNKDKVQNEYANSVCVNNCSNIVEGNGSNNLPTFDSYVISSFCAEKFRKTDYAKFVGSNITNIVGYSFDENLSLQIINIDNDEERINKLWSCTSNKYFNNTRSDKFKKYVKEVRGAYRTKQKLPKFKVKTWKRRTAFQNI